MGSLTQTLPINPAWANVTTFGAIGDAVTYNAASASIALGSPNLTAVGAAFTPNDIGKLIAVSGAGAAGAMLTTTIAGYSSPTQVRLAANAGTALVAVASVITYGTDSKTAIQAAITAGQTTGSKDIYFPHGAYLSSGGLTINGQGIVLRGPDPVTFSVNVANGGTVAASLRFMQTLGANGIGIASNNTSYGCGICNLAILGTNFSYGTANANYGPAGTNGVNAYTDFALENVLLQDWAGYGALYLGGAVYPTLRQVHATLCGTAGIGIVPNPVTPTVTGIIMQQVQCVANYGYGVYMESGGNIAFDDCWFENNFKEGVKISKRDYPVTSNSNRTSRSVLQDIVFNNCWIESNGFDQVATYVYGISITAQTPGTTIPAINVRFNNCTIDASAYPPDYKLIEIVAADQVVFDSCNLTSNFGPVGGASVALGAVNATNVQFINCMGSYFGASNVTFTGGGSPQINWAAHGMTAGAQIQFTAGGGLPAALTAGQTYYVIAAGLVAGSFEVSATPNGAAINMATAGTPPNTADYWQDVPYGVTIAQLTNVTQSRMKTTDDGTPVAFSAVCTTDGTAPTVYTANGAYTRHGIDIHYYGSLALTTLSGGENGTIYLTLPVPQNNTYNPAGAVWASGLGVGATGQLQLKVQAQFIQITRFAGGTNAALAQFLANGGTINFDVTYPCTG